MYCWKRLHYSSSKGCVLHRKNKMQLQHSVLALTFCFISNKSGFYRILKAHFSSLKFQTQDWKLLFTNWVMIKLNSSWFCDPVKAAVWYFGKSTYSLSGQGKDEATTSSCLAYSRKTRNWGKSLNSYHLLFQICISYLSKSNELLSHTPVISFFYDRGEGHLEQLTGVELFKRNCDCFF